MDDTLLAAFWSYEAALVGNDVDALSHWFLDSAEAMRVDPSGVLVGSTEITEFRRRRPPPPHRTVERLHLRWLHDDCAALVAETRTAAGARSTQLQVWQRAASAWRIALAQISPAQPAIAQRVEPTDTTVWREFGAPLVAATAPGPLSGLRVAVKDLYAVAGHRTGAGNPRWLAQADVQKRSAPAVQALLDGGASIAGIAQTDELAFSLGGTNRHYGTPPNPAAPDRVPGGSSSGCAAAVAGGAAEIGLGTDTAGSIRVPASYCGLYGLRFGHGLHSSDGPHCSDGPLSAGMVHLAPSFDAIGLLTRDAATLTAAAVQLGAFPAEPIRRILVINELLELAEPPVQRSFDAAVLALAGRRRLELAQLDRIPGGRLEDWFEAFRITQASEAWQQHGAWLTANPDALDETVWRRFEVGRDVAPQQRAAASAMVATARDALTTLIPAGTALLLPSTSGVAPRRDAHLATMDAARSATLRLTFLASLSGLPAVSAPLLAWAALPVGLSAIGADRSELSLVELVAPN